MYSFKYLFTDLFIYLKPNAGAFIIFIYGFKPVIYKHICDIYLLHLFNKFCDYGIFLCLFPIQAIFSVIQMHIWQINFPSRLICFQQNVY